MARTADPDRTAGTRRLGSSSRTLGFVATALLVIGATSCADDTTSQPVTTTGSTSTTTVTTDASNTDTATATPDTVEVPDVDLLDESGLTADEVAGLLWMREEEQLAHDVYVTLGDLWGLRIFENIASSESSHIEAVAALLDRYGIDDPAAGNDPGTFTNPAIQDLHDQLVSDGSVSLDAALAVGALIEELDISDLQARAAATENSEITTMYAGLERGSRNHLRAFTSQLDARGVVYEPTQLDPATFDVIVSGEMERGRDG
ncbi:MAG: DUF2202 domain-containing protein [Ilumatobacteraceae bacterium]|jgi:hypothetical protein